MITPGAGKGYRVDDADPFDLKRFLDAQAGTHEQALAELRTGRKRGHWIWFVLPQLRGLGMSATSQHYGITGLDEARAYAAHPVLGPRLRECARALDALPETDPERVLGGVDAVKLRSSMTLFARAVPEEPLFSAVLQHFFDGREDPATTSRL